MDISSFSGEVTFASDGSSSALPMPIQSRLIELAYDAIIVRDPASKVISWNRGAELLYGWSAQEALGQETHSLLQTRFPGSREELDHFLETGEQWHGELTHTRKDGTQVTVESRQVLMRDDEGVPVAVMEINRDITEQRRRESQNQDRYYWLTALVESSELPIIGKTSEGIITSWNQAAERFYGYSAQEAIGQPITIIFPEDRQDEFVRIMERITRGERVDLYETTRQRKDGTIFPVSITISPIFDREGQIIGASDIAHDITERKRNAEQERFLTEVSKVLASSIDYQETLANIARLVVPSLADWFAVDLVDAEGEFELIEVAHRDPEKIQWAYELRKRYPIDPKATEGSPRVARTGKSAFFADVTDEMLQASSRDAGELELARQIGYSSVMLVPLVARGETIGVVSFIAAESGKKYDQRDLALAEEVGRRAGVALDNARLYRDAQQARDQLEVILGGVADGILVYSPDSRILYANEAAVLGTGSVSPREMLETPPFGVTDKYRLFDENGQSLSRADLTHQRILAGEAEAETMMGYTTKEGDQPERWSRVKSRPIFDEHGKLAMIVTITHDITERVLVERRKDEFISMASHELKTPVTSRKGFTYILQKRLVQQGDTQAQYYLARMDAQLDKLTALIRDLLDVSRMQSGRLSFRQEPLALDALVEEVVENVQTTTTHRLQIEGTTRAQVLGDKERLSQVFINLLTNAIKYSPQADCVLVKLARSEQNQAVVSIQDFGIGIEKKHHEKIFERFYQVTDPAEKTYPGLGIGLYITHEIITHHNGRLWVESNKGQGATFSVALPLLTTEGQEAAQG